MGAGHHQRVHVHAKAKAAVKKSEIPNTAGVKIGFWVADDILAKLLLERG